MTDAPRHAPAELIVGRGVDVDPDLAERKAVVETLERYAAHLPPRARLRFGSPDELGDRVAPGVEATPDIPRWWVEAARLDGGDAALLPLEYAQLASLVTAPAPLACRDSTGIAAHIDRGAAIAAARYELLERAGLRRLCEGTGVEIALQSTELAAAIARLGYQIRVIVDRVVDGAFTAAAVLLRTPPAGPGAALVAGSGAAATIDAAAARAVIEAYAQLRHGLEIWPQRPRAGLPRSYDRFLHYLEAAAAAALLEHWTVVAPSMPPPPCPPLFVLDRGNVLTDALGLHVVQVLAPAMRLLEHTTTVMGLPHPFA